MTRPFIQLAPNMATLLASLKDIPFPVDGHSQSSDSSSERPHCLSALMLILGEQAEKDGFRLITINTEPKRIIMACNRQGKPPPSTVKPPPLSAPNTDAIGVTSQPQTNTEDSASIVVSSGEDRKRKSIRCGCKMRININFHTKVQAWRITSYESCHNHLYGTHQTEDDLNSDYVIDPTFAFSEKQALDAIAQFRARFCGGITSYYQDTDAVMLLQSLASSRLNTSSLSKSTHAPLNSAPLDSAYTSLTFSSFESSGTSSPEAEYSPPATGNATPKIRISLSRSNLSDGKGGDVSMESSPSAQEKSFRSPGPGVKSMLPPIKSSFTGIQDQLNSPGVSREPFSPLHNTLIENRRKSMALASAGDVAPLRNLTATAIEIDRYAMLHSSFKKLIALGCKKREWTEDILAHVGRMTERLAAYGAPTTPLPADDPNPQFNFQSVVTTKESQATSIKDIQSLPSPGFQLPRLQIFEGEEQMRKRRKLEQEQKHALVSQEI